MIFRLGFLLAAMSIACCCFAQGDASPRKKIERRPVSTDSRPVTEAEASATFDRVHGLLKTILHVSLSPMPIKSKPTTPVTKTEINAELMRIYKAVEPVFVISPKRVPVEVSRIKAESPTEKSTLVVLIEKGFIGNYGPLATGGSKTVTIAEFGDSVGFFLSRLGECTYTPSTKWTPFLHGN